MTCFSCKSKTSRNINVASKKDSTVKGSFVKQLSKNDTSYFLRSKTIENPPKDFDDNNSLHFKGNISLKAIASGDNGGYLLTVKKDDHIIFNEQVNGVTKVLLNSNKLFFATFTYVDEDGHNEGYGYIIDTQDGKVSKFRKKLSNTCNPILYKDGYVFYDGGQLIWTSFDMKTINSIPIIYHGRKKDNTYFDEHSVNGLCPSNDGNSFQIIFTPNKLANQAMAYKGYITKNTAAIILRDSK